MSFRRWFTVTLLLVVGGVACVCASSYALDMFGTFRDTRGRHLVVYSDERTAKALLNWRYVPENFDALLVGSSISANWDLNRIDGARVYNESMNGAIATEEKLLVSRAMQRRTFRFAVCVLNPAITKGHTDNEGLETTRVEALGSVNIFREEWNMLLAQFKPTHVHRPNGSEILPEVQMKKGDWAGTVVLTVDPAGVEDYRSLLDMLRSRGTRLVFVVPPVAQSELNWAGPQLARYEQETRLAHPGEAVIDFNAARYRGFRENDANYLDALHLSPDGANQLSLELNRRVQEALGSSVSGAVR